MRESALEKRLTEYCKQNGLLVRKFTSPSQRGVADRIVINQVGVIAFIEMKAPGRQARPLQKLEADRLLARGCLHWFVDSEAMIYRVMNWLRTAPRGATMADAR
jgi:hypothetical protein